MDTALGLPAQKYFGYSIYCVDAKKTAPTAFQAAPAEAGRFANNTSAIDLKLKNILSP
jgi:hypothetical protein